MSNSQSSVLQSSATRFAVVVPLYNKRPHVARALNSALHQTHAPAEIIVVDDASTDGGLDIVWQIQSPLLKILSRSQPGPGGYAARNLAIDNTTCEWIAFLDADDEWRPDHLATLHDTIQNIPVDGPLHCVFAGFSLSEGGGRIRQDPYSTLYGRAEPRPLDYSGLLDIWLELGTCPIWTSAAAFRRSALCEAGLFPAGRCRRGGDKDLWLRATRGGIAIAAPAVTAIYHRDAVNMVTSTEHTNLSHCICATVEALQTQENDDIARRLRRLVNLETLRYAFEATNGGVANSSVLEDYYTAEGPFGAAVLWALTTVPGARSVRALRRLRNRSR